MAESAAPLWRSRWVPVGFGAVAAGLVPWLVVLYTTLPGTADAQHWSLAWTGFDCLMAAGLASTGWITYRHDARAGLTAAATGALALVDAWFDVMTALPGWELAEAVLLAVCAELPLAGVCASIAVSVHRSLTCAAFSVTATVTPLRAKTATVESAAA
jgi:hypothetical protein